ESRMADLMTPTSKRSKGFGLTRGRRKSSSTNTGFGTKEGLQRHSPLAIPISHTLARLERSIPRRLPLSLSRRQVQMSALSSPRSREGSVMSAALSLCGAGRRRAVPFYPPVYWHVDPLWVLAPLVLILSGLLIFVVLVFRTAIVIGGSRLCLPLRL